MARACAIVLPMSARNSAPVAETTMELGRLLERLWVRVALILGAWTLFGSFLASQTGLAFNRRDMPIQWYRIFAVELAFAYTWALLTPLTIWLARRYPIERSHWRRSLMVHIFASTLIGLATRAVRDLAWIFFISESAKGLTLTKLFLNVYFFFDYGAMIYWIILLVCFAFDYYRRYQEGEIKTTRLSAQLAQAQLQALKMQLHPHFLFNTLHSISALVHKDANAADKMIARLGDFLRLTLDNAGAQEVSLQQEIEFLKCYLEIERIRFKDRLTVHMEIEPQALDARVPNLILQPIVENAIKHGIAPRTSAGHIEIEAKRYDGMLQVQVTDNGPGLPVNGGSGKIIKEGLGLANTQARLQQCYGDQHRLDLMNTARGGLTVLLEIPFKEFKSSAQN
jgi:two-component system LytT family sensor kinase